MNTAQLLDALEASLATTYPTRRALSPRTGRVGCMVVNAQGEYEPTPCDPPQVTVTAEVHLLAASMDEQGAKDLPHHLGPVGVLIREAGWETTGWRSDTEGEQPVPDLVIAVQAFGTE